MYLRLKQKSVYIGISPTKNSLHLGELRTFIYIYVFARKNNLPVYIRVDDTNPNSKDSSCLESILKELKKVGIIFSNNELIYWEGNFLFQSRQTDVYKFYLEKLSNLGVLSEINGLISVEINKVTKILEEKHIEFGKDLIRHKTKFNLNEAGYHYIPLYIADENRFLFHLPCIVDEYLMNTKISIRGEDKMPLMPTHDALRFLLDFPMIEYLHLPLLLMSDSTKRLRGSQYSLEGMLQKFNQEKIISYLIKSGYNGNYKNQITISEFIKDFDITRIKKQSNHINLNII